MKITTTELNKHLDRYLNQAMNERVIVEHSGHPIAVILSYDHYIQLEDIYWRESAVAADLEKSLGPKATMDFLRDDD